MSGSSGPPEREISDSVDTRRQPRNEPSRTYSGESGRRHSSVPGYDRERDQTSTTQAGLNILGLPLLGAGIGAGVGAQADATGLGAIAGAVCGLLLALGFIRLYGSRPMGG
jgi:hypothetical protein